MIRKSATFYPTLKTLLLSLVVLCSSNLLYGHAGNRASATAEATIVTPATMAKQSNLDFGRVRIGEAQAQSIVLQPAAPGQSSGDAAGQQKMAAAFTLSAESHYLHAIILPSDPVKIQYGAQQLTLSGFTSSLPAARVIIPDTVSLEVGASMSWSRAESEEGKERSADRFEVILFNN